MGMSRRDVTALPQTPTKQFGDRDERAGRPDGTLDGAPASLSFAVGERVAGSDELPSAGDAFVEVIPEETFMINDLIEAAADFGNFKTLTAALTTADLISTLKGAGPYTVFAPTDAAFAKLPKTTVDSLLADTERLKGVLLFHVLPGSVSAHEVGLMRDGDRVKTVSGKEFTLGLKGDAITVNGANVTTRDIQAKNGVIHAIDKVIMPS
jgi:uncharacterized surface protein with fasciclin (FAS1) repeats